MKHLIRNGFLSVLAAAVFSAALAGGGGAVKVPKKNKKSGESGEQVAVEHYNGGIAHRDVAWALEKRLAGATDDASRAKLQKKIRKEYLKAADEFQEAVNRNVGMFQAHSDLGYALRKTGDYESSLASYDRALAIEPDYSLAVEYRGETYLALNRTGEAKDAYLTLFSADRAQADKLLLAMKAWVEQRSSDPGEGIEAGAVESFGSWVVDREEIAEQTAPVSQLQDHDW
jgi:tetratricopeptide (TPR) repeat protein